MGPFRVIVTGVRHFRDYARLRDLLDWLLARRLPEMVILSRCGRGTDALATSYAVERGLQLVPHPLDFERDRTDEVAAGRRNAALVADADGAVVMWDRLDRDLADLLGRCRRKVSGRRSTSDFRSPSTRNCYTRQYVRGDSPARCRRGR
jgi:hypothetical protein